LHFNPLLTWLIIQQGFGTLWRYLGFSAFYLASFYFNENILNDIILEVFTEVTMKNAVFWDDTACGFCKNLRYGGTYRLYHQGDKNWGARNNLSSN
jgi:hypothetical protein